MSLTLDELINQAYEPYAAKIAEEKERDRKKEQEKLEASKEEFKFSLDKLLHPSIQEKLGVKLEWSDGYWWASIYYLDTPFFIREDHDGYTLNWEIGIKFKGVIANVSSEKLQDEILIQMGKVREQCQKKHTRSTRTYQAPKHLENRIRISRSRAGRCRKTQRW